jgi:hypothetical protein
MATLQFMDKAKVRAEIIARGLKCEVPECSEHAVALAESRLTILMCQRHNDAFLRNPMIAKAIISATRTWLKYHIEDIYRYAYEGQEDDPDVLLVVGDDALNRPDSLLDQARRILDGADKIASQISRVVAASNAAPVMLFKVLEQPKVRPPISSLPTSNLHPGMQLFG